MLISRLMWVYCQQISCDVNDLLIGNYDGHIVLFRITPTPYRWIFTDRMLFLTPNQQCQSTEGNCSTALPQHICEKSTANRNCVLYVLFCSLAVFDARVGHSMDILSPFIPVLCHSDWLFHGESCPRLDVVHPGRAWSSSPAYNWHCSLHYLFLQATPLFPHVVCIMYVTSKSR